MKLPKELCFVFVAALLISASAGVTGLAQNSSSKTPGNLSTIDVDYRALVSRSDLIYQSPVAHPVEGQPIGNGVMGTMVWTTPDAIHFQINRTDVFATNKSHTGHHPTGEWRGVGAGPVDYCGGIAQVTLNVGGNPFQAGASFLQRLSLYDAQVQIAGAGVRVRCFISSASDVLVVEVDDQRTEPQKLRATVSMWREPEVKYGAHVASYRFGDGMDRILVQQRFTENDHYCASGLAARILADDVKCESSTDKTRTLTAPPERGPRTVLVASTASWSPQDDVGGKAMQLLDKESTHSYDALRRQHAVWWSEFWSRGFVHVHSPDGLGDFMERVRNLHLYYMASTSRGLLPPKFNGSNFITDGDTRVWGSQFWIWTTEAMYYPLFAADAIDLTDPFFRMFVKQLPACEQAAKQRYGAEGAFYPETAPFDGPVVLPDDVVEEYRDILFGRKDAASISPRLQLLCSFESILNVTTITLGHVKQYTWASHIASSGAELGVQAWWRYRFTGDTEWLRESGYPMLKGVAEFYRTLVKKGNDGRYHLYETNVREDFWGVKDSIWDLAAIRGTVPLAIRAAEILGVDAELRAQWQELLENLAPYPMGSDPQSQALKDGVLADDVWAAGHLLDVNEGHTDSQDGWLSPVFPFEHWTLQTRDPQSDRIVKKLVQLVPRIRSILEGASCNTCIRTPIATVRAGFGEKMPALVASYYRAFGPIANGMGLFEGHGKIENQAHSIEPLGLISTVLQEGLMQSVSPRPGEPEVISVFPAWPKDWDASFRLLARGGFLVTSATGDGKVEFVEIESRLGETCRLRNPWGTPCLVTEIGGGTQTLDGDLLVFDTVQGKRYRVAPEGGPSPALRRVAPTPTNEPTSYSWKLSNGKIVEGTLGRRK